ncbi:PEPxxWA-CTERM sorting domain-containing protein [Sphingomonas sp. ID0503]|uniref:PEPxxWA-CTERM sorting domain-containing protein n=1 Tax=Sphingomonas sp. ID0503 TaxID=3399691 RepID=UPI003AFAE60E
MTRLCIGLAIAAAACAQAPAFAAYYVSPRIFYGDGEEINGTIINGATSARQEFHSNGTDLAVTADLKAGTVKSSLNMTGPDNYGQVVGTFGDTLTFSSNAIGQTAGVRFRYDGSITAGAPLGLGNSTANFGIYATLYAYRAGSGVSYLDYGNAKYDAYKVVGLSDFISLSPTTAVDQVIDKVLNGAFVVDGAGSYDVFAGLSLFAATNDNPINIGIDFSHTGQFGIDVPAGATYTSDSGVFLTETAAVPEPASWAMLIGGFGLIGGALRGARVPRRAPSFG